MPSRSFEELIERVPARFPPTRAAQSHHGGLCHTVFVNPHARAPAYPAPLSRFEVVAVHHTEIDEQWPIPVSLGLAVRGFRHALALSQVAFADRAGQSRVTIERWEAGTSRPYRGSALHLLSALRPLVPDVGEHTRGQVAAGQLLGVAAHAVCRALVRPAGTYTRHEVAAMLTTPGHDHSDLAPALISAMISAEILMELDASDDGPTAGLIPRAVVALLDRSGGPWDARALAVASVLTDADARLWLDLGERLARRQRDASGRPTAATSPVPRV